MRVLIIGNPEETHVGGHFLAAGRGLKDHDVSVLSTLDAFKAPRLVRSLFWRFLGHRPARLASFGRQVIQHCEQERPDLVLSTGLAPLPAAAIGKLRQMSVKLANFLTDDPWNRAHRAPWFLKGLGLYDHIFTPRHANEGELLALAGPSVSYLPFAYATEIHFPPAESDPEIAPSPHKESVTFIGGADEERARVMTQLKESGIPVDLWGGYWSRYPALSQHAHGHAGPPETRRLVSSAAINLCLVRKANRDGHSMRSLEIPAIGGCMLAEDTREHRALFGDEGECVRYFATPEQLATQARTMLAKPQERYHLAQAVHDRICQKGRHTYADRLEVIIDTFHHS